MNGPDRDYQRARLGIDERSEVLLFVTEGATDPVRYEETVGHGSAAPPAEA